MSGVDISPEAVERRANGLEDVGLKRDAETMRALSSALDDALAGESRKAAVIAEMEAEMERMEAALREAQRQLDATNEEALSVMTARDDFRRIAADQQARIERMEAALHWYAADYDHERGCSQWDGGSKARQALYREPCTDGR